jgi:hypothetical protein
MPKRWYAAHRWLGALVGVQLLLWTVGGLIFATHDLAWVRGEEGRREPAMVHLPADGVKVSPGAAIAAADFEHGAETVELRLLLGRPVYVVRTHHERAVVDADTGALLSPLDAATASDIARADREPGVGILDVTLITHDPATEYREKPLPAWRARLNDGEGTHIYVDALTGAITARRNDAWRRFDWFWMLHTMDYGGRDDFNHPLLMAFAALAVVSVLSGGALWGLRLWRRRSRRRGDGVS